jgi:hypothetical protein
MTQTCPPGGSDYRRCRHFLIRNQPFADHETAIGNGGGLCGRLAFAPGGPD